MDFGDSRFQRRALKLHFLGMPLNISKIYNHLFLGQFLFVDGLLILLLISLELMYLIHGRLFVLQ